MSVSSAGCTEVCCHLWSHSYCCCFTPGTFTNQVQAPRRSRLLVVTDPRADCQPLTEVSCPVYQCPVSHRTPLHCVDIAILCNKGVHLVTRGGCWPGKFCACMAPSPMSTCRRSCLISTSTEILKRLKRKSIPLLNRL